MECVMVMTFLKYVGTGWELDGRMMGWEMFGTGVLFKYKFIPYYLHCLICGETIVKNT